MGYSAVLKLDAAVCSETFISMYWTTCVTGTVSILGNVHLEFRQMDVWKKDYEAQKWMRLVQIMSTGLLAVLFCNA